MKPESKQYTATVGGERLTFETGKLAAQAGGSVTVRLGDSIVFAAATMGGVREGIDFFPLSVEYEERLYASGKIPGSFFRREGKPTEDAILTARLTDRPLRPLFNQEMRNEVQVVLFSMSADGVHPLDILAINAASAALMISDIPWEGPVGAVRVGMIKGELIANPTFAQMDQSDLDLRIAGTKDAILMVECGANEIPEDLMIKALAYGHEAIQPIIAQQEKMAAEIGKAKKSIEVAEKDSALLEKVSSKISNALVDALEKPHTKAELYDTVDELEAQLVADLAADDETLVKPVKAAFEEVNK
jgi:polyribonucleotide nucleotidyltransferase